MAVCTVVVVVSYPAWILGVGAGPAALGVPYPLARIVAGLCEAAYVYAALRWPVFRDPARGGTQAAETSPGRQAPRFSGPPAGSGAA